MLFSTRSGRVRFVPFLQARSKWARLAITLALTAVLPERVEALVAEGGICDRTVQVRDAIVAAVADVDDCADITATHLSGVTSLSFFGHNISALQAGDFAGLSALDSLSLAFNRLRTLPAGIFDGLTSLEFLHLAGNELMQLPDGVFAGLTSLATLVLTENVGYPFGPTAHAGPTSNVGTDARITLRGRRVGDPWGRDVTFAWTQIDETGVAVPLEDANTATPSLTAPAVEARTRLAFQLAVTAVNPGAAPPGTTPAGDTGLDTTYVFVGAAEPVTVSFVARPDTATEGGNAATVEIRLDRIPRRKVSIPLEAVPTDGADAGDYSLPEEVTFGFVDRVKYVAVTATDDDVDDDGESLTLRLGSPLPVAVTAGTPAAINVALEDNDGPAGVAITGLAVTSDPGDDDTYTTGDVIEVTATFDGTVTVSCRPRLTLSVGNRITELRGQAAKNAGYVRGSGSQSLVFAYRVADGDSDPDGVSVDAGSLLLNGGTIQAAGGADALLEHDGMQVQSGHRVDAVLPGLSEAFVNGTVLTLRYTEPLDAGSVPSASAFEVSVAGVGRAVSTVEVDEERVTLVLASAVQAGEEVTVGYTAPANNPIRDRAGLAAGSFASESVTNYSGPGVGIEAIDPAVYEGMDVDFRLFRNGPTSRSLGVTVDVEDDGDVLLGAEGTRRVTFAAGDSTAFLTLRTHDDHGYEAHATVTATVLGGGGHVVSGTHGSASVKVSDNDLPEMFVTMAAPDSVEENVGRFNVRIEASTVSDEEPHGSLSVRLGSADGTATSESGGDYSAVDQVIRFLPDDYNRVVTDGVARYIATMDHGVTIHNDVMDEEDETFSLRLTRSYVIGDRVTLPAAPHVVTVIDNDDAERVAITGLAVTSDPGDDATYTTGDAIEVTATFDGTVTVSGRPQLTLSVGDPTAELRGQAARNAGYVRRSGSQSLVFAYRVADGDSDPDGVSVEAGSLLLNGGTIQAAGGADALLEHDGVQVQSGHRVDAVLPELSEAFVNGTVLTLRYTEPLDAGSLPSASAFEVSVAGVGRAVSTVEIDEERVTLVLASAVTAGEVVAASYTAPANNPIRDRAGLAAESFASESVTNDSDPGVGIEAIDAAVYEGMDVDFRLFRNGPTSRSLGVNVEVEDDGDVLLGAEGTRRVTFAAGDSTALLTLRTHDDNGYEAHATVTATVAGGGSHVVSGTHGSASVKVSDNDLPEMSVTMAAPDSVEENVGRFNVRIEASTVSDEEPHGSLSVRLGSADGTATSGSGGDFSAVDEVIRFLPDDYNRIVTDGVARYIATMDHGVTIHNDTVDEEDETFSLGLTRSRVAGDRVTLPAAPHVVTVIDNDDMVYPDIWAAPSLLFMLEGESMRYRVTLQSQPQRTVTVTMASPFATAATVIMLSATRAAATSVSLATTA